MDWFERLTGFREIDYDGTRAKLKVEERQLHSLVNGKSYGIGELELVSLQTLRERVRSADGPSGRLRVSVVTGDVREMHRSPEYAGALFQVASQFNLLEMVGPEVTPEDGVTRYQSDRTQGPACAIAARRALALTSGFDIDVRLVSYGAPRPSISSGLIAKFPALRRTGSQRHMHCAPSSFEARASKRDALAPQDDASRNRFCAVSEHTHR